MAVSPSYQAFILEQLSQIVPVQARKMFSELGLSSNGLFFAIIADDVLYLKADETTRLAFEAVGARPFLPYGDPARPMSYYEAPAAALEDPDLLREWVEQALLVASQARKKR
jgi:DNA transformation protein and related proteins